MLKIGEINSLPIARFTSVGAYLAAEDQDILLPRKYVPRNARVGERIEVFVYADSEDRLIATTQRPLVTVGHHAVLVCKEFAKPGAFMDWGLEKDLLVPHSQMREVMQPGRKYVVRALLDENTSRLIGTTKLRPHFLTRGLDVKEGDEIDYLIYDEEAIGYFVVVNDKYGGIIYRTDAFGRHSIGQAGKGFVKTIREDGKLDIVLRQEGYGAVVDAQSELEQRLRKAGGFLPYHDKTDPAVIQRELEMSKGSFKKAIGGLYRRGVIAMQDDGIRLVEE